MVFLCLFGRRDVCWKGSHHVARGVVLADPEALSGALALGASEAPRLPPNHLSEVPSSHAEPWAVKAVDADLVVPIGDRLADVLVPPK